MIGGPREGVQCAALRGSDPAAREERVFYDPVTPGLCWHPHEVAIAERPGRYG